MSELLRENTEQRVAVLKRELELREKLLLDELHYRTLETDFHRGTHLRKKIEQCKTNEAVMTAVYDGFKPIKKELVREIVDADVERLLQVRIRRISLFEHINKHREEMEKTKSGTFDATLQEFEGADEIRDRTSRRGCWRSTGRCIRA